MTATPQPSSRLPALDGLRAIAVLVVIMGHSGYPFKGIPADLGVNLFFVLSGFLITGILLKEYQQSGTVSLRTFYKRRAFRIFPAYYAFLALSFAIDRYMGDQWSTGLSLSAVSYTVNYFNAFNGHPTTAIAHAWSLAVEEQFYVLWPLALLLFAKYGKLTQGLIGIAGAALVVRIVAMLLGADTAYVYNAFEARMDCLAIGCLLAVMGTHKWTKVTPSSWHPLVTIGLLLASRFAPSEFYHYTLGFTVEAILCAVLLVQLMHLSPVSWWRFLDHRVMRYVGTISYPMYLYHALGGAFGRRAGESDVVQFGVTLGMTILIASGSYYVIEKPFLRLRDTRKPAAPIVVRV